MLTHLVAYLDISSIFLVCFSKQLFTDTEIFTDKTFSAYEFEVFLTFLVNCKV